MKKLVTTVLMALAFVTVSAISAFCANVVGEVSGLSRRPLSGVQLSLANPAVQVLAQAGSNSGGSVRNPQNSTNTLVSDGLLTPGGGAKNLQANAANNPNQNKEDKDERHERRCKHGEHEDEHEHCVPSGSE
jgi:hypothetical protein